MKSGFKTVFYKFLLRSFYFSLLLVALMGPSFGNFKKEVKSIGKEIYIVTDISLSMNASDIQPSRIEKAKQELKKMVTAFGSDRVGLILFGSSAFIQCPPTHDQGALMLFIKTISTDLLAQGGSDISQGLKLALEQHKSSNLSEQNKVILLVTDGEHFGDLNKANEIAKEIKDNAIKLVVLGIGSKEGSKIPAYGSFKKDKKGNVVISKLESASLKELSEEAEGLYFEINEKQSETDFLIKAVEKMEGVISDTMEVEASANKYFYFLLVALCLIILDVLITVRTVKI